MGEKFKTKSRQVLKTKTLLHEALIELMLQKSYESIVVQEILDKADVGRSTFYMHYHDKDELLVDGLSHLKKELKQAQVEAVHPTNKKYEKVISFSLALFEHAHEGRALYKSLSSGQGWSIVRSHIEKIIVEFMKEEARPLFIKKNAADVPFELFIYFLGSTFMSVMAWWLNHRTPPSPKEMNNLFRELVIPALAASLVG